MKHITDADILQLRETILKRHDLVIENYMMVKKVVKSDHQQMVRRLEAAAERMDHLMMLSMDTTENLMPQLKELMQETNELRVYFGAPTGRPLEDRGVDFVPFYIRSLEIMIQIDPNLALYEEMIRTELALLEYRLQHQQDIKDCLRSLIHTISSYHFNGRLHNLQDSLLANMRYYLMLICQVLEPHLRHQKDPVLLDLVSRVFLEIASTISMFKCSPETLEPQQCETFLVAMLAQLMAQTPSKYTARICSMTALWLWQYPLQPDIKNHVAYCFRKAQEVLKNA